LRGTYRRSAAWPVEFPAGPRTCPATVRTLSVAPLRGRWHI